MPLKIDFKSGDKLVINGAVLENVGPSAKILVHNESAILREKEILSTADTETPASRVYFALQCAYIFPHKRDEYLKIFRNFLDEYVAALPSADPIVKTIIEEVESGRLYKGLKSAQQLIAHETQALSKVRQDIELLSALKNAGLPVIEPALPDAAAPGEAAAAPPSDKPAKEKKAAKSPA